MPDTILKKYVVCRVFSVFVTNFFCKMAVTNCVTKYTWMINIRSSNWCLCGYMSKSYLQWQSLHISLFLHKFLDSKLTLKLCCKKQVEKSQAVMFYIISTKAGVYFSRNTNNWNKNQRLPLSANFKGYLLHEVLLTGSLLGVFFKFFLS